MKYMLLMQFSAAGTGFPPIQDWTPEEISAHIAFMGEVNAKLVADGEWVDGQGLAGPAQAKIVRAGAGGAAVVTEGPFAETKEFLAGYWIVDVESAERAVAIAAWISTAPGPAGASLNMPIEVHPVMSAPPQDV